jgi:hypothetical protein
MTSSATKRVTMNFSGEPVSKQITNCVFGS